MKKQPHTPRHRQRGVGMAEYIAGTALLLAVLLVPFGSTNQNVAQRLISAIQQEHAGYVYVASLPSLPRGPGGDSTLPTDWPVPDGASGDSNSTPESGEGAGDDPGETPDDGLHTNPGDSSGDPPGGSADDGPGDIDDGNPPGDTVDPDNPPEDGPGGDAGNGGPAICATDGGPTATGGPISVASPLPGVPGVGHPFGAGQPTHVAATHVGNPINVVTGNKFERQIDLRPLPGAQGLAFVRYYNSRTTYSGSLGHNWRSNYALTLRHTRNGIEIWQADGRRIDFHYDHSTAGHVKHYRAAQYGDGTLSAGAYGYDWQWRDGTVLVLDRGGRLSSIRDAAGHRTNLAYNAAGQIIEVTDPQGRTLKLAYNASHRLRSITNPAGAQTTYAYDDHANLTQVIGPDGVIRRYHYTDPSDSHNLTGISRGRLASPDQDSPTGPATPRLVQAHATAAAYHTEAPPAAERKENAQHARLTRIATWAYDAWDRAILSTHAHGVDQTTLVFQRDRTLVTNSQGQTSVYHTAIQNGVPIVTAVDGPGCSACGARDVAYEYNDALQLTRLAHADGITTRYTYDETGRTTEIRQAAANGAQRLIAHYLYADESRNPAVIIEPSVAPHRKHAWFLAYEDRHRLAAVTETGWTPDGQGGWQGLRRTTDYRVHHARPGDTADNTPHAQPVQADEASSLSTYATDIETGRTNGSPDSGMTRDANGRVIERVTETGTDRLHYDARGHLTRLIRRADSAHPMTVDLAYDAAGHLTAVTGPKGTARAVYDGAGRLQRVTGPDGETIDLTHDSDNHVLERQVRDAAGHTESIEHRTYDSRGRLTGIQRDGQRVAQRRYDAHGRLAMRTNAAGVTTAYAYGPFGRLIQRTRAAGTEAAASQRYAYDPHGHSIGLTDARGHTARTQYDDFGNQLYTATPDGGVTVYRYNNQGERIAALDEAGRLRVAADVANTPAFQQSIGAYAVADRSLDERQTADLPIERQNDGFGRLTAKTLPDGTVLQYRYDRQGRLIAITRDGWWRDTPVLTLTYNARGQIATRTGADGRTAQQAYDSSGRVKRQATLDLGTRAYRYDALDRLTEQTLDGATRRYTYDPLGRLMRVQGPDGATRWSYDATGNRTAQIHNGVTTRYTIARDSNRLQGIHASDAAPPRPIRYDATGKPLQRGNLTYRYNAAGRMTTVYRHGHKLATYAYDDRGRRIKKTVYTSDQPRTTRFVYDGAKLAATLDAQGRVQTDYLYQGHRPIALIRHGDLYAVHTDSRSAPIAVANASGTVVWRASYSAFGQATVDNDPDGDGKTFTFNLRLTGQYADAETGTNYNIHRDYDPRTGRYLTSDPFGIADGANTYAYVHSDPMNRIDPLGLYGVDIHYYMVYFLAREAGLDPDTTQIIANASEYVDVNPQTRPIDDPQPLNPNAQSLQLYHFALDEDFGNRGDWNASYQVVRLKQAGLIDQDFDLSDLSADEQREWYRQHRFLLPQSPQLYRLRRAALSLHPACDDRTPQAKANATAQLYGEYLHALGDSFAHRDKDNQAYSRATYPGLDREYLGHGLDGHNPDATFNHRSYESAPPFQQWNYNEAKTLAAEHAIFYKLRQDYRAEIRANDPNAPPNPAAYDAQTDRIWSELSGAKRGNIGYARIGYDSSVPGTDDHPIDGPNHKQNIGVLQRFNADHDFDSDEPFKKGSKVLRLRKALESEFGKSADITEFSNSKSAHDRFKYLGNITEADLQREGFTYKDEDNGGKEKAALLLPCGSYRAKSVCKTQ